MKLTFLASILLCPLTLMASSNEEEGQEATDFSAFLTMSFETQKIRESRLISIEQFSLMSADKDTLIIDARSSAAYRDAHIAGAININFSDFTAEKLKEQIPSKSTRILIYCNNNFISQRSSLLDKALPLALNVPTFINLYGYGYHNIYELADRIHDHDTRVKLVTSPKK